MKKLLLILLCLPMIFSCGNNLDKEITTEMLNDGYTGKGTHTYGKGEWEGEKYVGEFKDGKMHRQGTYTWTSGDKYVGEFKDDQKHGQGTYTYANGEKYVGGFKNDQKHGQGTYTWADRQNYVGEFKNDGPWDGTIYDEDGRELLKFVNGERIEQSPPIKTID